MRGYAPTALAVDGCYELGALVADAVALHDALGGDERAVLIGNDWGAEAAYGAAVLAPERWRKARDDCGPARRRSTPGSSATIEQLKTLLLRVLHEDRPRRGGDRRRRHGVPRSALWQDWSPGYDATEDLRNAKRLPARGRGDLVGGDRLLPSRRAGAS